MNEENMVETGQGAGAAATDAVSLVKKSFVFLLHSHLKNDIFPSKFCIFQNNFDGKRQNK